MEPEVKQAKAILLNYLLKEKEEMAKDDHKAIIRKTDFFNLIKELEDGLKTTKGDEDGTTHSK